ncbi:type VI secretion system-associated FHA domain protein TagH [Sphingomonas sp. ABOLD]|uniref:Type VI secretion system protein ImpI/type VI secretion system protein n=1 Tax=Sphingomonas trueperi TaxID=53317 RepID=A0A7X5XUX9_9SPHN|nr:MULTISPECIES: type VI secretion system-associated FHA domain protein TagH [Sphingomonas]NJB95801.1 type VI secretion system protein ImpI/type VI secretion system protein [Sphingomonas trueperi]RSV39450.1 type VI secretion system-associated FHA domain protein TagH [Sphingomonas sp. ABOLE]RSV49218.1 type VI secretion system-associated FHA domain protein TagH [Sphingomonas sp. ABOLD]
MTLTLTLQPGTAQDPAQPAPLRLDGHGALIGRSPHADWHLPDPRHHISSRHCEVSYRDGAYLLTDLSTNGTFVNDSAERLTAPHVLRDGDRIAIGDYRIAVSLPAEASAGTHVAAAAAAPAESPWGSWDPPAPPAAPSGWDDLPAAPPPDAGLWAVPEPERAPSDWASAPRESTQPSASDVWGQLAAESAIDWSRGDFGAAEAWSAAQQPAPLALPPQPEHAATASQADAVEMLPAPASIGEDGWAAFLRASGVPADRLRSRPAEALAAAGAMLRQMVSGLILMVDARARAKAQLGTPATSLELEGNNPIKFVRSPERALLQLLDAPEPGFMDAARAVEDAYQDLQAHQMATLSAMRGALTQTLAQFAPDAIHARQPAPAGLARWSRQAREAALWRAYVRDFEGVVRGADEAFMDRFAKEFRGAYEEQIAAMRGAR